MIQCTYQGDTGKNFQNKTYFIPCRLSFSLANSADTDEMPLIWVCTDCKSTDLGVSSPQRVINQMGDLSIKNQAFSIERVTKK